MYRKTNYPVLFLLIIVAFLAFFLFKNTNKQPEYDSSAIMEKIAYVKELSLVKYNYNGVISYKDAMKFLNMPVPLTEKSFLIRYNGYVKAGIDMSRASVSVSGKNVKVNLPKPTIQETVIDEKTIQVFDESMNIFNPTKVADYQKAIVGEKNKISQDVLPYKLEFRDDEHLGRVLDVTIDGETLTFKKVVYDQ